METKPESTSTTGTPTGRPPQAPKLNVVERKTKQYPHIQVRPKVQDSLTAYQLTESEAFTLPSGMGRHGFPGEWVVCRHGVPFDVLPEQSFQLLYEPQVAGLLIPADQTAALVDILGLGACQSPKFLLDAVKRLADLKIGDVSIQFTPGQLEELARKAEKNGHSVQAEVERIVAHLSSEVFWNA